MWPQALLWILRPQAMWQNLNISLDLKSGATCERSLVLEVSAFSLGNIFSHPYPYMCIISHISIYMLHTILVMTVQGAFVTVVIL